jgi:PAS domain S-box-containing protein
MPPASDAPPALAPPAVAPAAEVLLDALPWGVLALDAQGIIGRANPAAAHWCGTTPAALLGQPLAGVPLPPAVRAALLGLLEQGSAGAPEAFLPHLGQWLAFSASPLAGGGWLLHGHDITERRQREQSLAFLAALNVDFAPQLSAEQLMAHVSEQLAAHLGLSRCHLAEVEAAAGRLEVTFDWRREASLPPLQGPYCTADYLTAAGQQHMAAGQPLVSTGLAPTPFISMPLEVLAGMGFGSLVDIPLLIDGQWCFLLTAARAAPGEWRPDEVALLQQLASRLHARLARAQAETALQVAHDQLADVLEHTHDAFYRLDTELRFTYVNRRAAQLWGRERASLLGHVYWQLFPQAVGSEAFYQHQEVLRTRQPVHFETLSPILNVWIEVSIYPNRLGGISVFFRDISARRHVEERRDFVLQLSDALRPATDPIAIQEVVTRLARRHFGADRCYYCELEDGQAIIRRDASSEGLPSVTGTYRLADFALLQAEVVAGQPFWVRDVRQDEHVDDNLRELCVQLQIISNLDVPVVKGGRTVGVLCLVQTTPREWAAADIALATEVADRTWAAVTHARAEAALQASEQRLRTVMENLPGGAVFVVDAHLRYQLAEGMALRQLGLQAADFVGRPVQELAPPPLWPDYERLYRQALAGQPFAYEHVQDGRTFATRGGPLRLANGTVAAALTVSYDITASKQTETALKESEEKYRTLFNSIDEGYCIIEVLYDAQGQPNDWRFVEVNPAFEKNNGLAHATGKTIRELTPDIEPKWIATYAQVAHTGEPLRFEEDSLALGRWFSLYAFPVGAPGGPLVAVLFTDITARKQAEDSLRLSEIRLSLALRAGRMGSFEWTSEGNRITLSAISQEVLGLPPDAEIATSEAFFELVHPDDRARHQATFAQAGRTGADFHSTYRIVRPLDGEVRWLEERGLGTHEPGVGICLRGVHWDVTETVQTQQQLAEFNGRLEQRVARRTHELRASRDLLQSVFDTNLIAMSVMEAVRAADGTVQDFRLKLVSRELVRTTGRTDLVGKLYSEEYPGIREVGLFDLAVRTLATGEPQNLEYYYNHEGFDRWFACQFVKLGDGVVATNLDITERKTAEQERLKNLRLLEQAEAVAGLGSWDYDLATGTMRWSAGMYQLFGLPVGSPVAPANYLSRVVPDDRARARRLLKRLTTGAGDFEETLRLRIGSEVKTLRLKAVVLRDEASQPLRVLGVELDISELQRLEQDNLRLRLRQQQGLFEAVQAAQEAERKRIAESLHNGLGQILYAAKLHLDRLHAPLLGIDPALAAARLEADQLLREAIRQTRALSHELVPLVLADFGLPAALQDVCRKMSTPQLRLRCHVQLDKAAAPLGPALQMALYRMAQELTQNIIRHAHGATAASLELETMPGWVLLRVEDNGPGFGPATPSSPGLGLRSIRDQVALLGGQLEAGTAAVGGAYVRIRIPLFTSSTSS